MNPFTAALVTLGRLRDKLEALEARTHDPEAAEAAQLAEKLAVEIQVAEAKSRVTPGRQP